jgi:hypothetical protein
MNVLNQICSFVTFVVIFSLLLLHWYLHYIGMTTYEYILSKRQKEQDISNEDPQNKVSTSREIEITRITPEIG